MRNSILTLSLAIFVSSFFSNALCADTVTPSLKEASVVTEVLPRGETITAVRLEYTEGIYSVEVGYAVPEQAPDSSAWKYRVAGRSIVNVYVNNSGKKDDVDLYGKYVFLDLDLRNSDFKTYRAEGPNPATRTRPQVPAYTVNQISPVATRSGKTVAPTTLSTTREICDGMDDYKTFAFKNEATGHTLYYHLFIPRGYESRSASAKNLPLVVHYPAGDYSIADWTGKYRGALFTHHDALYWSDEESQSQNPAFVVTLGGPSDPKWGAMDFSESEMQQNYLKIIQKILADFNVDASRIYAVSLAGGSPAMWNTIIANPTLFAAEISTSYDPYHAYRSTQSGEDKLAILLKTIPGWFFAALNDPTGTGILGAADTRLKGERLRDIAAVMNKKGFNVDVAYGKEGELMWNGLLRGEKATKLAQAQLARAKAKNASHLVTLYIPGTIPGNPHLSWDATYSNAAVRRWLFQQVSHVPYRSGK